MGKSLAAILLLAALILVIVVILTLNSTHIGNKRAENTSNAGKEIILNISKLNTSLGLKLSNESAFEASFKVEMFVSENRSLKATKTILLKNIGNSEKGMIAIYYLYPTIKVDKIVLKGLELENASITQGKDVIFLAFELPKGKIGEVKIYYEASNVNLQDFGWYSLIFGKYAINNSQIEISPAYFLDEKFNGSISNYTISLTLPSDWNGTILDADRKGYWTSSGIKREKERRVLTFTSNSSKSPFAIVGLFDWVTGNIDLDGKQVKISLLLPRELEEKDEVAKTVEDILRNYSEWYGEYPFSFLQVVVSRAVQGGINGDFGVILVSDQSVDRHLSHEIAHFWFGSKAHFGTRKDESLATFSELTYFNKLSKKKGKSFTPVLDSFEESSLKYNISLNEAYSKSLPLNETYAIVYQKGGMIFRSLQFVLGNETFFDGMKQVVKKCKKICSLADVQMTFEKISNQDLDWFFKEWFYSAKVPDYEIENLTFNNHTLSFEISDKNNLKMPVEIEVVTPVEVSIERVWVDGVNKTQVNFNIERKPEKIVIDPNEWMVNWNKVYWINGVKIRID